MNQNYGVVATFDCLTQSSQLEPIGNIHNFLYC